MYRNRPHNLNFYVFLFISEKFVQYIYVVVHLYNHGRNSNLIQFEILPVESSIGVSTKFSLVKTIIGLSSSRISNSTRFDILPS